MPTNLRSSTLIVGIPLMVLASLVTACTFVDDEPRIPFEPTETDDDSAGSECQAAVQQVQPTCTPPQQLFAMLDEDLSMILVDDPTASIQVAPHGWLVQVPSASHYVGSQSFDDGHCTVGCGFCQPGQSLCHTGFDEDGPSGCMLCLPWDTVDPETQCAQIAGTCVGADDGSDTGSGATGDTGTDEPLDEPVPGGASSSGTSSDGGSTGSGNTDSSSTDSGDTDSGSTGHDDDGSERGLDETGS